MRLPVFFTGLEPVGALLKAEDGEEAVLLEAVGREKARLSVSTADEEGLSLWEKDMGLPDGTGEPETIRRGRILTALSGGQTLTRGAVTSLCRTLTGQEPQLEEDFAGHTVEVWLGVEAELRPLQEALTCLKPAHLQVKVGRGGRFDGHCPLWLASGVSTVVEIWAQTEQSADPA